MPVLEFFRSLQFEERDAGAKRPTPGETVDYSTNPGVIHLISMAAISFRILALNR
jgi:hypothetical protein